jgi:NADH-quinone oxidoreductase subunit H
LLILLTAISGSASFLSLTVFQWRFNLNIFILLPILPVLIILFFLETNRIPFDVSESESELVAGYTTEYGGFFFVLFYLSEYFHLYCFASVYSICFLGAWYY